MAVYDYSYKTWQGLRRGALFRWLAIPKFAYLELLQKKMFTASLIVALLPVLLLGGYIYLLVNLNVLKYFGFPTEAFPPVNGQFFKRFLNVQLVFCFYFAFQLGAGLIARDLKNNAIVLFISKPISRWEYFAGKFVTIFGLLFLITGAPGLLLFALQYLSSPPHSPWRMEFKTYFWIAPAIALYAALSCATLCLLILAASSLTKTARYAGITFAVYIIGAAIVARILAGIIEQQAPYLISPMHAGRELGNHLFRSQLPDMKPLWIAWGGIGLQCALASAILFWRLKNAARYGT